MELKTGYLKTTKTARYATYGNPTERTRYFWFCLHGSQMTCEQILYKFSDFDPELHYVVSAEGLNRFYLKGFGGDVVASWMTKRDRLHEIADFSKYLTKLYNQELSKVTAPAQKIALGFSQGGTTLYRWLHQESINLDAIIAHSCWIPEDINLTQSRTELNKLKTIYTYGNKDQFLAADRIIALKEVIAKNNLDIEVLLFEGKHKIDRLWLKKLWQKLI